jgi:hypothetical protein
MIDRTPLLVLAMLPDAVQVRLDGLRRVHYPAAHNRHPAHCTLFHAVPGMVADELSTCLAALTAQTPPPRVRIDRVLDLDSGTALAVIGEDLIAVRQALADRFHGLLTAGDALPARLHVTIQNKVDRPTARALQRELAVSWRGVDSIVPALAAMRVVDGAWLPAGRWRFRGSGSA